MASKTIPAATRFDRILLDKPPFEQFVQLYEEALRLEVADANAMAISTVSHDGWPSSRIVLLKSLKDEKLTFYTNYNSQKARELAQDHRVSLLFFWQPLAWQIRIEGRAEKSSREDSEAYFRSRDRTKQIGAWASPQSDVIESYELLQKHYEDLIVQFEGQEVPCPEHWGGYDILPDSYEFWFGRQARLHERYCFVREGHEWRSFVKAP